MHNKKQRKGFFRKLVILAAWLMIWQIAGVCAGNQILLVGPMQTAASLLKNTMTHTFWLTIGCSVGRIGTGFLTGLFLGLALACASARFSLLEEILSPVMALLKAIPVASFVVLLLIWWGAEFLSAVISFLVVLPGIYIHTLEGIKSTDQGLLEMARVFHIPFLNRFFYIYRPAMKPFLDGALKISLGMSWKSGVAAEVIGTPKYSLGERLYLSKIYLDTADVFAWTAAVILISFLFEKLIMKLWKSFCVWQPHCLPPVFLKQKKVCQTHFTNDSNTIGFYHVTKKYGEQTVLADMTQSIAAGETVLLTQPSGGGKTTILRLLAGLETPQSGRVEYNRSSMVFQEDRLCELYSAVCNVAMVTGDAAGAVKQLSRLLPADCLEKPCALLSGGMKRRVALVRALAAVSQTVLLDEPFTGLDEESRRMAFEYIKKERHGRTLVIATHNPADVKEFTQ